jgi:outer membrane protein assembly factor BamB
VKKNIHAFALIIVFAQITLCQVDFWPMQGHDAQRTSRSSVNGPIAPSIKWSKKNFGGDGDNNSVIVGTNGTFYMGGPAAYRPEDGSEIWSGPRFMGYLMGYECTGALSPDGNVVYTPENGLVFDTTSVIFLVARRESDGKLLWRYLLDDDIEYFYSSLSYSSLAVDKNGTIYVGTWRPAMYAINPNGTLKWRYLSNSDCGIETPPAIDFNGNVYFVHNCLGLVALDSTGSLKWIHSDVGGDYGWPTPLIGQDGTIYIRKGWFDGTTFFAINSDSTLKWKRDDLGSAGFYKGAALSEDGTTIYTAASGKVYALNSSTGETIWSSEIASAGERFGGSPVLSGNSILYIMGDKGSGNDYIYAVLVTDGSLLWKYQLDGSAYYWGPSSPSLGPDGTLYVSTHSDAISFYAFFTQVSIFPILSISKTIVPLGHVDIGSTKDDTILVRNVGTDTLTISAISNLSGEFLFVKDIAVPKSILPESQDTLIIRFAPTSVGNKFAFIVITHNAISSPTAITISGSGTNVDMVDSKLEIPEIYTLFQNYPNPFNPTTTISFKLPVKSFVSLKIFNPLGKEVSVLLSKELAPGTYSQQWNATGLPSGAYFYRLQAGIFVETKKLILLR